MRIENDKKKRRWKNAGRCILTVIFLSLAACRTCSANNLSVGGVELEKPDASSGTVTVSFDMSWDNSWRNSVNHDAVWVFVKYTKDLGLTWEHATLGGVGTNPPGMSSGGSPNIDIVVPADRKGCLFRRGSIGAGRVDMEGVQVVWDWSVDGLSPEDEVGVRVIGIEMVYIPSGAFYAGDGDGNISSTYAFKSPGAAVSAIEISAGSVNVSSALSPNDDIDISPVEVSGSGGLEGNGDYPTGYRAFYMMKYEITEGQWVDFFNMISSDAKDNRDITGPAGKNSGGTVSRNTISRNAGLAVTSRPERACGYLSWPDLAAYLDWAALRPMTELEFEKAARGAGVIPAMGEYAWGVFMAEQATVISGAEGGSETVTNEGANVCYGNVVFAGGDEGQGPLRAGIFATAASTRSKAGAGYYGNMELSGNLWERTVTLGNPEGRMFRGSHGDGILQAAQGYEGNATNADWPGYVTGQGVSAAAGSGFRGGSWADLDPSVLGISDRSRAATTSAARLPDSGGRGVRSDPGV
jgi:formylglycine-generating enzyme required for sulfatase activity